MKLGAVLVPVAVVVLAACSATDSRGSADDDSFTLPSGRDKSFAPSSGQTISGTLTFDDIEGGCAYLQTADGKRYEVIYPDGWVLDRAGAVLRGPDGTEVAAGRIVRVTGSTVTDRSSICQVGPMFLATLVEAAGE